LNKILEKAEFKKISCQSAGYANLKLAQANRALAASADAARAAPIMNSPIGG
jgi:hypothetical protein